MRNSLNKNVAKHMNIVKNNTFLCRMWNLLFTFFIETCEINFICHLFDNVDNAVEIVVYVTNQGIKLVHINKCAS